MFESVRSEPESSQLDIDRVIALYMSEREEKTKAEREARFKSVKTVREWRRDMPLERNTILEIAIGAAKAVKEGRCPLDETFVKELIARAGVDAAPGSPAYKAVTQALAAEFAAAIAAEAIALNDEVKCFAKTSTLDRLREKLVRAFGGHVNPIILNMPGRRGFDGSHAMSMPVRDAIQDMDALQDIGAAPAGTPRQETSGQRPAESAGNTAVQAPIDDVMSAWASSGSANVAPNPTREAVPASPSSEPSASAPPAHQPEVMAQASVPPGRSATTIDPPPYVTSPIAPLPAHLEEPIAATDPQQLFSTAWAAHIVEKIEITKEYAKSRRNDLVASGRLLTWIEGDLPTAHFTSAVMKRARNTYVQLPNDYKNFRRDPENPSRDLPIQAVIAFGEAKRAELEARKNLPGGLTLDEKKMLERVKPIEQKTYDKHYTNYRAFFPERTMDGLFLKFPKSHKSTIAARNMVPLILIKILFETPVWCGRKSDYFLTTPGNVIIRDSLYWIPLMGGFHGMRREECAQLQVKHIKLWTSPEGEDIWYFDLTDPNLQIKNDEASCRHVPLHSKFLQAGFLDAVILKRDSNELLFPELANKNENQSYGAAYGARFENYIDTLDKKSVFIAAYDDLKMRFERGENLGLTRADFQNFDPREARKHLTNHGLRHTFRTCLENIDTVKSLYIDVVEGHSTRESRGEAARYTKLIELPNLKRTVDALKLPINIELLAKRYDECRQMKKP